VTTPPDAGYGPPVRFTQPHVTGRELEYIRQAVEAGRLAGDGPFTKRCEAWLEEQAGAPKALLTHSGTAALEMAVILAGVGPGDEVIMPSYTFVSTANAAVLRGGVPVFVDVRPDTFNLDESKVEAAVTPRTKAILPVHYAGVAAEMDPILDIARRHGLVVIEDAAQGLLSRYRGRPLGGIGRMAALSFHETKNVTSGEGGALLVNDPALVARAEVVWEKGTNRRQFFRGEVDKYTWVDVGSSFLPGELTAAFLLAQLEAAEAITAARIAIWDAYHAALAPLEAAGLLRRPVVPPHCTHNGHMYPVLMPSLEARTRALAALNAAGYKAVFHYVPLHSAPAGRRYGRVAGPLPHTEAAGDRLLRLPLWVGMPEGCVAGVRDVLAALP
jgi:dTDP-4-amino-4,6-dideoxygalactose transaminase